MTYRSYDNDYYRKKKLSGLYMHVYKNGYNK